ncbi:21807_t:CDS:1, partial [Gigaspora rosea]
PIIKPLSNEEKEEILFNSSTLVEKRNNFLHPLVEGGSKIVSQYHDNSDIGCTAGFWIKKNNQDFILTAGHCAKIFPSLFCVHSFQNNTLIGPMDTRIMNLYDIGYIRKTNTRLVLRPIIRQINREDSRFVQLQIVGISQITNIRVYICKAGAVTGFSCGKVTALNTVSMVNGFPRINTFVLHEIEANGGDSGGPMFRFNGRNGQSHLADAVGIHFAGNSNAERAIGLPINIALRD